MQGSVTGVVEKPAASSVQQFATVGVTKATVMKKPAASSVQQSATVVVTNGTVMKKPAALNLQGSATGVVKKPTMSSVQQSTVTKGAVMKKPAASSEHEVVNITDFPCSDYVTLLCLKSGRIANWSIAPGITTLPSLRWSDPAVPIFRVNLGPPTESESVWGFVGQVRGVHGIVGHMPADHIVARIRAHFGELPGVQCSGA